MGVDYYPVAGFSIKMTDEIKKHISDLVDKKFPGWETKYETIFDALKIGYSEIGSSYTGDIEYIPMFVPKFAIDLDYQIDAWLKELNEKMETTFDIEDVIFVKELRIS